MKSTTKYAARSHVRSPRGRRGTPQAAPRDRSGQMLRGLLATVGIAALFLLVAAGAFLQPGQSNTPGGDAPTINSLFPTLPVPSATAGPTSTPGPHAPQGDLGKPLIALVAGHTGDNPLAPQPDPGAVCADGLTEAEINQGVADRVARKLQDLRQRVVVLGEFDARLSGLRATVFVSIHADSCDYINDEATGFKVAGPEAPRAVPSEHERLTACLNARYGAATGMISHDASISRDMNNYHAFDEIDARTPAAIIEVGFMYQDRQMLTEGQDRVAQGIVDGILCFLQTP